MIMLDKATNFIWENARLLERAIFSYHFCDGAKERILEILQTYQNEDGGLGHALEPDLRTPDSQPLYTEFGLRTLYACGLRDAKLTYKVCDFLAKHADLEQGISPLLPSARKYPYAAHWDNPKWEQPSRDRLIGLVGLANLQGVRHPWLQKAVEICVNYIAATKYKDAHTILTAFCLLESLPNQTSTADLFSKLALELIEADFFCVNVPVSGYALTPLDFAPTPAAYCREIFSDAQISAHLNDLASKQEADGGWPITWDPPGSMAKWEWRSQRTVNALCTLQAYERI